MPERSAIFPAICRGFNLRRSTAFFQTAAAAAYPCASAPGSMSFMRAGRPLSAASCAMPPPMTPAPSTPTRVTGSGRIEGSAAPLSFLTSSVQKKIESRFLCTSPPKMLAMCALSISSADSIGRP